MLSQQSPEFIGTTINDGLDGFLKRRFNRTVASFVGSFP
jgi:hypothetical protein